MRPFKVKSSQLSASRWHRPRESVGDLASPCVPRQSLAISTPMSLSNCKCQYSTVSKKKKNQITWAIQKAAEKLTYPISWGTWMGFSTCPNSRSTRKAATELGSYSHTVASCSSELYGSNTITIAHAWRRRSSGVGVLSTLFRMRPERNKRCIVHP